MCGNARVLDRCVRFSSVLSDSQLDEFVETSLRIVANVYDFACIPEMTANTGEKVNAVSWEGASGSRKRATLEVPFPRVWISVILDRYRYVIDQLSAALLRRLHASTAFCCDAL